MTQYRVNRDKTFSSYWAVQRRSLLWPFWVEYRGLLNTVEEAYDLIDILNGKDPRKKAKVLDFKVVNNR